MKCNHCQVLRCFLFLQVCLLKPVSCQFNETLHDYCIFRLPPYQSSNRGRFSVSRIVQMCGHLEEYASCVIRERAVPSIEKQYDTALYEKKFPEKYDLYRALYLYCGEYFPRNSGKLARSDSLVMRKCEHEKWSDLRRCSPNVSQRLKLQQIQLALDQDETEEVKQLSCSIQAEYTICLEKVYTSCEEGFAEYFLFLQSRLGSKCLRKMNMYNKLLMHTRCYHSGSNTADVSRVPVVFAWIFIVWIALL